MFTFISLKAFDVLPSCSGVRSDKRRNYHEVNKQMDAMTGKRSRLTQSPSAIWEDERARPNPGEVSSQDRFRDASMIESRGAPGWSP